MKGYRHYPAERTASDAVLDLFFTPNRPSEGVRDYCERRGPPVPKKRRELREPWATMWGWTWFISLGFGLPYLLAGRIFWEFPLILFLAIGVWENEKAGGSRTMQF